jgi:hypothetical protein
MSARRKLAEYVGTRVNTIVGSVSDPAVVAAIGSLTQALEYQRRAISTLSSELIEVRRQMQNLGTSVNGGYLHMSNQYDKMCTRNMVCQHCEVVMLPSANPRGNITNVHNSLNVDIPLPELEVQVDVPTFANVPIGAAATTINVEVTPTDLARAAGIDAVNQLRASNDPHLPNMSVMFPTSWNQLLAEWRREHLSDFDRKGVPSTWKDSKLQQRFAKRLRCIRLIRRIATTTNVEESVVVADLDRILNSMDKLTVSKQLADLERQDTSMKRRIGKK